VNADPFPDPFDETLATEKRVLPYVSAAELAATPPEVPPVLVEGVLYQGGTAVFSGASKSQKTYTMLDLSLSIATGRDFFGLRTTRGNVIYLNLELQAFAIEQRMKAICAARGVKPPENLYFCNLRGKKCALGDLRRELPQLIKKLSAALVVIDPHYKISSVSGFEENSNDGQGELLSQLEEICAGSGAALCIAHHFAKGDASTKNAIDRASGGGVLARWPDVIATMTEHEEATCMTLELRLRNFAPVSPFVLRWNYPVWTKYETLDPDRLKKAKGGAPSKHSPDRVLDALPLDQWMTSTEWNRLVAEIPDGSFRRIRDKLWASGKVELSSGQYRRKVA
jgi:hypothetical protein